MSRAVAPPAPLARPVAGPGRARRDGGWRRSPSPCSSSCRWPRCSSASVTGEGRLTLGHFREALSRRLYVQALKNSLVLGAWTALLSVAIGLPMAWAVSRTDVPAKPFIHATAMIAYLTPPYLTAIAFVNLFSPNAGLVNRWVRDVLGLPQLTFNIHSMAGLVLVTVLHTFPFVYLLAASALESVDASMEESARILGRGPLANARAPSPLPLVAPAILAGALIAFVNAIALFGSQAIIGLPGRIFTLPTRIYALFDHPPQYGLASALSLVFVAITVVALGAPAPLPGPALVRHARRQGQPAAARRPRPGALGGARVLRRDLRRGGARAVRHAPGGLGEPVVGARVLAEPDARSTTASSSSSTTSPGGRS